MKISNKYITETDASFISSYIDENNWRVDFGVEEPERPEPEITSVNVPPEVEHLDEDQDTYEVDGKYFKKVNGMWMQKVGTQVSEDGLEFDVYKGSGKANLGSFTTEHEVNKLWREKDCFCKWGGLMMMFEDIETKKMRVVDLGTGEGPLPHMISARGHDVTGVDNMRTDHPFKTSLAQMVLKDAIEFLTDIEEESVDVFTDSCSVTHFDFGGGQNPGWKNVLSSVYQKLKPGGYFLIASDCHALPERKTNGEFLLGEEIAATARECGFTLTSEFNDDKMDIIYRNAGRETDLSVATFMLKK